MNSSQMKERFDDKYRKFFNEYKTVLSLPFLINWTWDILPQYTWIHVKQKIPLRMYLWVNRIQEKRICFKNITFYDINEDVMKESKILDYFPYFNSYEEYFDTLYAEDLDLQNYWFEISLLAEVPQGASLGFPSISTFLFFLGIEKMFWRWFWDISAWKINDQLRWDTVIRNILFKSIKLKRDLASPICVATQINAFFPWAHPIVSFVDDESNTWLDHNLSIYGYRLSEIDEHISTNSHMHVDFWIAYCGSPVYLDNILHKHKHAKTWMNTITTKLDELFWKDMKDNVKPNFYRNFVEDWNISIEETYRNIMGTISLEVFYNMLKLFSSNYDDQAYKDFIDSLDKARWWYYITQNTSNRFKEFVASLIINFEHIQKVIWITPNDTSTYGWAVSFMLPMESYRKQFLKSFETTKRMHSNATIIYTSWTDWIESLWYKLEQDVDNSVYSDYCNAKNFMLTNSDWKEQLLWDYEELLRVRKKWIVVDTLSKKILLDWERLTSEELPSQQTAIALLEMLLVNPDKEISNKDLPRSSYSRNRNDMVWKIILPLNRLFAQTKSEMSMSCRWTLDEYFIKLERSDVRPWNLYLLRKTR